jgi:hypothetical protein
MKNIPASTWTLIGVVAICVSAYLMYTRIPDLQHAHNKPFVYGNIAGYGICMVAGIFLIIRGMRKK